MRTFITSINKYLSNDMKIFGTCSIPLKPNRTHHSSWLFFFISTFLQLAYQFAECSPTDYTFE